MGNKGAFITMGSDLKPNFTTYDAVVSEKLAHRLSTIKRPLLLCLAPIK